MNLKQYEAAGKLVEQYKRLAVLEKHLKGAHLQLVCSDTGGTIPYPTSMARDFLRQEMSALAEKLKTQGVNVSDCEIH